jgi:hypothetical protein
VTLFTDTSAFLKLLVHEEGTVELERAVAAARELCASAMLYPEVRSSLARHAAERRGIRPDLVRARERLESYWSELAIVDVSRQLIQAAGDLAERHVLRGADAVHLASALALQLSGEEIEFACWDARLRKAARAAGLATLPDR